MPQLSLAENHRISPRRTVTRLAAVLILAATAALGRGGILPAPRAAASTFAVTKTADTNDGVCDADCSLREAMTTANASPGADTITFAIPGGGPHVITVATDLPDVTEAVDIDGTTESCTTFPCIVVRPSVPGSGTGFFFDTSVSGGSLRAVVIQSFNNGVLLFGDSVTADGLYVGTDVTGTSIAGTGNAYQGIEIEGSGNVVSHSVISGNGSAGVQIYNTFGLGGDNLIDQNEIGADVSGTVALGNGGTNVAINDSPLNTIRRNVIVGSSYGISIDDSVDPGAWEATTIQGNAIGTDATGTIALPNFNGIHVGSGSSGSLVIGGSLITDFNIISFNSNNGVEVADASVKHVTVVGNSIHANGAGIFLVAGANGGILPPVISSVTTTSTTGIACANCLVQVYSDEGIQGQVYYGGVVADGVGNWTFSGPVGGSYVTATATGPSGTSEFSSAYPSVCTGTCIAGLWEGVYNTTPGVFNHCTASVTQLGDGQTPGQIGGSIDCTTAHNGTLSGSINQTTKAIDITLTYPTTTNHVTGTVSADGSTGSGTWTYDCTPSCGGPFGPYAWSGGRVASTTSAVVTSAGGTLTSPLGDTLTIPAGALSTDTAISAETIPLHQAPGLSLPPCVLSRAFRGQPDGTTFSIDATAVIHFTSADLPPGCTPDDLQVLVFDSATGLWIPLPPASEMVAYDPIAGTGTITFSVSHFTDYGSFDCGALDADADGIGDLCDLDYRDDDGDGYTDAQEVALGENAVSYCNIMRADVDGDGMVTIVDLSIVASDFLVSIPPAPAREAQGPPPFDTLITIIDLSKMAGVFLEPVANCP